MALGTILSHLYGQASWGKRSRDVETNDSSRDKRSRLGSCTLGPLKEGAHQPTLNPGEKSLGILGSRLWLSVPLLTPIYLK